MRRLVLLALLTLAVVVVAARPAAAHDRATFRLCAAVSATDPQCYNGGVTYEAGQTVFLRGRITPPHAGFGQVLRRAPGEPRYEVVGTIGMANDGRTRWSWPTKKRDIDGSEPYLVVLRIGGHRSNPVEVWVVPRHDP